MPLPTRPRRLYKYRGFTVNTLRMLSEAEVFFASPSLFNDPLDCNPTLEVDVDVPTLEGLLYKMVSKTRTAQEARRVIENHQYMASELGDYKESKPARDYYVRRLGSDVIGALKEEYAKHGVLSLASRWNCPLMWSHYGDQHQGLCVEYDLADSAFENLDPVDYKRPRRIKASELVEWKLERSVTARESVERTFFFSKAPNWRYEREWRSVADRAGVSSAPANISAIHFGLRCDSAVVRSVVLLHASGNTNIKFYAMRSSNQGFRLVRSRIDTEQIRAVGIRTSAALDFRDVFSDDTDA